MSDNKYFISGVVAVVLIAGLLIYATGNYGQYSGNVVYNTPENVQTFHLRVSELGFDPYEIVVHKDDKVKFSLKSIDFPHSLNLPEFGMHIEAVEPGELGWGEFVASKTGEFEFYDNERAFLEKHEGREEMLKGTLIVLP